MSLKEKLNSSVAEIPQPEGLEIKGNLSFGRLGLRGTEKAGDIAFRTGEPQLCGSIVGLAWAVQPDTKNSKFGQYNRIIGEFYGLDWMEREVNATECFLPGVAERFVIAALARSAPVRIAMEGWCYPDASSPAKYVYKVFMRQPPGVISLAKRMAIEAGVIAAPEGYEVLPLEIPAAPPGQMPLLTQSGGDGDGAPPFDPETGEIAAEEARIKDGLSDLLGSRAAAE